MTYDLAQYTQFGMAGMFIAYLIYQSEVKDKRIIAVLTKMEQRFDLWEERQIVEASDRKIERELSRRKR
jgi:hypothetical protein